MSNASACFHCGQDIPTGAHYLVTIDHLNRQMCCPGCQAVAQAIVDNQLEEYYHFRTASSQTARDLVPDVLQKLAVYDNPVLQNQFVNNDDKTQIKKTSLILEGIVCAACVWLNEKYITALPGVIEFRVNYTSHRAQLTWNDQQIKLSEILKAIAHIGYLAHPLDAQRQEVIQKRERHRALRRLAVSGLGAMQVMMLAVALYAGNYSGIDASMANFFRWISLFIATPVVLYSGWTFYQSAWRDLRLKRLGMDVPVAASILIAYVAGIHATWQQHGEVYFDSITMFIFFLNTGRYLEMQARHRAGAVAEAMVKLIPAMANRLDSNGAAQIVAVTDLQVDDRVLIKPGETVPADGVIFDGISSVDESLLTGESMPVAKQKGDVLIGGSVNMESPLLMQVSKIGSDTILASIQRLLDRAQTEKPDLAKLADRVAGYFVGALILISVVVGLIWWQIDPAKIIPVFIAMLVVTCPCALSLATPTALIAATGRLMQLGVLTTRGHALETLAKVEHVIFDKTGTLTQGKLKLERIVTTGTLGQQQCLAIAAALEHGSEHPLAQALLQHMPEVSLQVSELTATPGQGMQGIIEGVRYRIGRAGYAVPNGETAVVDAPAENTSVVLASAMQTLAVFYFSDQLREDAAQAVQELQRAGIRVSLYSGDQSSVVAKVASQLSIDDWRSDMTPQQKLEQLQLLQQQGTVVAMIGDGINDAPVLSAAQVSLAMGNGTQLAQASADMILMSERLLAVPLAVRMARRTYQIIRQNLLWSILYNVVVLPLAAVGWITPWMAGIGMSASSLLVVFNALRLSGFARENPATRVSNSERVLSVREV